MKSELLTSLALGVALLIGSVEAFGHHGTFVSYDSANPVTMKAVVTEFHYTNPHIQLYFDVKDDKGEVTHWSAEGPDPAVLVQAGWGRKRTEAALAPGTEVTVTVAPARNGKPVGAVSNIVFANGDSVCGLGGGRGAANCK
jgi:hypothetical protein